MHVFLLRNCVVWEKCIERFRREVVDDEVLLYVDQCRPHFGPGFVEQFADIGIHQRPLIANATHFQQPVDQNVGNSIKAWMDSFYYDWVLDVEEKYDAGETTKKVGIKEKRAKIFKFAQDAFNKLKNHPRLIEKSWTNFGVELPWDGSEDDKDSTVVL